MQLNHAPAAVSAVFDDGNMVSVAGLVPVMRLAEQAGLGSLARQWVSVPTDKGANAGEKVSSLVGGMVAGADSIEDMNLLRHGGMSRLFDSVYAPSTLGSFLRAFTFGHVRQLDAVASRLLQALARRAPILPAPTGNGFVFIDLDDTVIEVHSSRKQGAGIGYNRVRGLNAALVVASTTATAPVILAQRLRRGQVNSPRGAGPLLGAALATLGRTTATGSPVLVRADSAYYGHPTVSRALRAGAHVSVTVKRNPAVNTAIAGIPDTSWTPIDYPHATRDPDTGTLISDAEIAETPFTAFRKHDGGITGRLIVRRVKAHHDPGTPTLFDTYRYHAFFTTLPTEQHDTLTADQVHRAHAIIENVHADLKHGPLAHLPSGHYPANAAWLVLSTIAYNLTRTTAVLADHTGTLAKALTHTIRRTLIHIPARLAHSARRTTLHLPRAWPWEHAFTRLFTTTHAPPPPTTT